MKILFDFKCDDCSHVQEEVTPMTLRHTECKVCGGVTTRQISPVRSKLNGLDPGFPDAYDKWARDHYKGHTAPVPEE